MPCRTTRCPPVWRGRVLEAAWWGFVGGAALLIGALLGLYIRVGLRVSGLVMAFGFAVDFFLGAA